MRKYLHASVKDIFVIFCLWWCSNLSHHSEFKIFNLQHYTWVRKYSSKVSWKKITFQYEITFSMHYNFNIFFTTLCELLVICACRRFVPFWLLRIWNSSFSVWYMKWLKHLPSVHSKADQWDQLTLCMRLKSKILKY